MNQDVNRETARLRASGSLLDSHSNWRILDIDEAPAVTDIDGWDELETEEKDRRFASWDDFLAAD